MSTSDANGLETVNSLDGNRDAAAPDKNIELIGTQTNVTTRADVPPDGGYGWVVTSCVFLINANTWGVNSVGNEESGEKMLQDADGF